MENNISRIRRYTNGGREGRARGVVGTYIQALRLYTFMYLSSLSMHMITPTFGQEGHMYIHAGKKMAWEFLEVGWGGGGGGLWAINPHRK